MVSRIRGTYLLTFGRRKALKVQSAPVAEDFKDALIELNM